MEAHKERLKGCKEERRRNRRRWEIKGAELYVRQVDGNPVQLFIRKQATVIAKGPSRRQ